MLIIAASIASEEAEGSGFVDDPGLDKVEELLALDPTEDEDSHNQETEEQESGNFIWTLIGVALAAFVLLGVFNHIIIPFCCVEKIGMKDKEQGGAVMKMSEMEKDEKKNNEAKTVLEENKRGSNNEGFEDVPLTTAEKDIERIESIENENFDKTILKAVSAIEVSSETPTKVFTDNDEYTKTPRNSLTNSKEKADGDEAFSNEDLNSGPMPNIEEEDEARGKDQDSQTKEEMRDKAPEELIDNSSSAPSKDAKEMFRSRKKSMISIEIEDGNIKNFVEGPPGERVSTITETNQE